MEQSALFNIVWVFILSYKIAIFSRDITIWVIKRKRVLSTVLKN